MAHRWQKGYAGHRMRVGRAPAVLAFVFCCLSLATRAHARTATESPYSKGQTYNAAVRYLRVNLGYEVTERDPESAYLLFRYVTPGSREPAAGSIEVVETDERVMLYVELQNLPSYHEVVLRDGLLAKLRAEYGEPRRKKPRQDESSPERPKDDAGGSGGEDGPRESRSAKRARRSARDGSGPRSAP